MNESEKSAIMGMIDGIMGLVAEKDNDLW
jgi:hypothetical protein